MPTARCLLVFRLSAPIFTRALRSIRQMTTSHVHLAYINPGPSKRVASDTPHIGIHGSNDPQQAKVLASRAYVDAKHKGAIERSIADKWLANTAVAANEVTEPVAARMWSRTESVFRLLIDRQTW